MAQEMRPFVCWLTGLPGSGKSTIAQMMVEQCREASLRVEWLDGDRVREIIGFQGFSAADRRAYLMLVGYCASLLERNGVSVIASFVSPYRETRDAVRAICSNFVEVAITTPLAICEARDPKGMYQQARMGKIPEFTGVSSPYEPPLRPEISLDTSSLSVSDACQTIMSVLKQR